MLNQEIYAQLFPAYAGVILCELLGIRQDETFPRIRGGDPILGELESLGDTFSPHTRG